MASIVAVSHVGAIALGVAVIVVLAILSPIFGRMVAAGTSHTPTGEPNERALRDPLLERPRDQDLP